MDLKALQKEVDGLDYDWKERNTEIEGISIKTYGERVVLRDKEKLEAELNGKLNELKRYWLFFLMEIGKIRGKMSIGNRCSKIL